jgi:GTP-binding protein Era
MAHKSGFVNIIGNPNVGKSTLMNALVLEKLSIITSKAQTTRHRLMGIVNGDDFQIVYSDTPGILKPAYKLQQAMMKFVETALEDADIILYVTDTVETPNKNQDYFGQASATLASLLVLANNRLTLPPIKGAGPHQSLERHNAHSTTSESVVSTHGFTLNSLVDIISRSCPKP